MNAILEEATAGDVSDDVRWLHPGPPQWSLELEAGAVLHADSEATAMPAFREVPATTADFLPKHTAMHSGFKPWLQNGSGLTLPERLGGKLRERSRGPCNCGE